MALLFVSELIDMAVKDEDKEHLVDLNALKKLAG
jgi:hypothetical protein